MAIYPKNFNGQYKLQPGARGEKFKANLPGYRSDDDRINRTNIRLAMNEHDSPNITYMFDNRLPTLFRYGYDYGFNQMVIPKGRIVSVDQYRDMVDFDSQKEHNTLTLANGGAPVRLRKDSDKYKNYGGQSTKLVSSEAQAATVGNTEIEWAPLIGMDKAYTDLSYRPFNSAYITTPAVGDTPAVTESNGGPMSQLTSAGYHIDETTGYVVDASGTKVDVLPGNIPIGIIIRNEYTRDDDAFNGMAPGAINTDCMVELPWFAYKDKAEGNPWGSAYGGLFPGALVKSDENGRFVVSPLSFENELATMTITEYELERQQVIAQVYSVSKDLVPQGAAKWATWALNDRLAFEEFNPLEWPDNNRHGEDSVARSPYKSSGKYPGYPYDKSYGYHDLHMLGSIRKNFDQRMEQEYRYENLGIPGLTDGYNAVKREIGVTEIGTIRIAKTMTESLDLYFRFPDVKIEDMRISIGSQADANFANLVEGGTLSVASGTTTAANIIDVKYVNALQGLFVLNIKNIAATTNFANTTAAEDTDYVDLPVYVTYSKRGLAGVPTFMDWDGCVGSVKLLLQK
jgi:hypothetical protein